MIQALLAELDRLNVKVFLVGDRLRLNAPTGVLTPALKEAITKYKDELVNHLACWNEPTALSLFRQAVERIRRRFPPDCIGWAKENQSELWQAVLDAEAQYNQAFHQGDMAAVKQAVAEYERAFGVLIKTYENKQLTAEQVIAAFGCGRVWDLPPGKAAVLDAVFAKRGIRWND
jgi:hypothetical protein